MHMYSVLYYIKWYMIWYDYIHIYITLNSIWYIIFYLCYVILYLSWRRCSSRSFRPSSQLCFLYHNKSYPTPRIQKLNFQCDIFLSICLSICIIVVPEVSVPVVNRAGCAGRLQSIPESQVKRWENIIYITYVSILCIS